jgi:hypothetical protein
VALRLTTPSRAHVVAIAAVASLITAQALADKPASVLAGVEKVTITAIPIDFDRDNPNHKQFGKLVWRGGVNLFCKSPFFGGYSALIVDSSGESLLAVSDAGTWLRADIDHDGRMLKGLTSVTIGPILGPDGKPLAADRDRDSEGLALLQGDTSKGTALVSFERNHRILRYPFTPERFGPPQGGLTLPAEARRMNPNRGIEALAPIRAGKLKGATAAFSERLLDKKGNYRGWLIGGPAPGAIAIKDLGGFDITDAAPLPDGGLVLLERRFRYSEGIKMRIRRIAANELKPGALITGDILLEATDALNIDNMEAISAHRSRSGETILTLMSDDNFSPLQRTLLMQFALVEGKAALAAPHTR